MAHVTPCYTKLRTTMTTIKVNNTEPNLLPNLLNLCPFCSCTYHSVPTVDWVWNVTAHAQKPHFVFRRNGRVHLNRRGRLFSRLLAAEVCASAVVMLDTPCSEVMWRVLATHAIRQFPLHFTLPCVTVCHHVSTGLYHRKCWCYGWSDA